MEENPGSYARQSHPTVVPDLGSRQCSARVCQTNTPASAVATNPDHATKNDDARRCVHTPSVEEQEDN